MIKSTEVSDYVLFLKFTKLDLVWVDVCAVFISAILKDEQFFVNTMLDILMLKVGSDSSI